MKRKLLKWTGIAAGVLLAIHIVLSVVATHALNAAQAALRQDGRPLTLAEIAPPPLPDERNAAVLYRAAVLRLRAAEAEGTNLWQRLHELSVSARKKEPTEEAQAEVRRLWQDPSAQLALHLIEEGARKPDCRIVADYAAWPQGLEWEDGEALSALAGVLTLRARALGGADPAAAWAAALLALRVAEAPRQERLVQFQARRLENAAAIAQWIGELRPRVPPAPADATVVHELLAQALDPRSLQAAYDGERIAWTDSLLAERYREHGHAPAIASLLRYGSWLKLELAAFNRIQHEEARMVAESVPDAVRAERLRRVTPAWAFLVRTFWVPKLQELQRVIGPSLDQLRRVQSALP